MKIQWDVILSRSVVAKLRVSLIGLSCMAKFPHAQKICSSYGSGLVSSAINYKISENVKYMKIYQELVAYQITNE